MLPSIKPLFLILCLCVSFAAVAVEIQLGAWQQGDESIAQWRIVNISDAHNHQSISIEVDEQVIELPLIKSNVLKEAFEIRTASNAVQADFQSYGSSQLGYGLTMGPLGWRGFVDLDNRSWFIERRNGQYIAYTVAQALSQAGWCPHPVEQTTNNSFISSRNGDCTIADIAIAADVSMYNEYGQDVQALGQDVTTVLLLVNRLYVDEPVGVEHRLSELAVETSANEWFASSLVDVEVLIDTFGQWALNGGITQAYDVSSFWTNRDLSFNGSTANVGYAYIGVICTDFRFNLLEHKATDNASIRTALAHELGHNWGAAHIAQDNNHIMAPSTSATNTAWSAQSIARMDSIIHESNACLNTSSCTVSNVSQVKDKQCFIFNSESLLVDLSCDLSPLGMQVEIWDLRGRVIQTIPMNADGQVSLPAELKNGTYLLALKDKHHYYLTTQTIRF